jgi:hypothetical protein
MNVQLDIERLSLDGLNLSPVQRQQLQAAFEQEITRLIDERGLSPHITAGGAMPSLKSAPIQALASDPVKLGTQIAQSVYFGIGNTAARSQHPPIELPESGGQPIEPAARSFLEARLGHDLKRVRVHTNRSAARSAQAKQARAYAIGRDIVFGADQYDPHSEAGRRLLAHEVTHVIQQNFGASSTDRVVETQSVTHEREATEISRTIGEGAFMIAPQITRTARVQLAADKKPPGWDEIHNYKHPGNVVVGLTIFKTTGMSKDFVARYVEVAKKMLKEHGLGLDVYTHATKLDWTLPLQTIEQVLELRMLGHKAYQDERPRLPIFFAPMHYSTHTTGQTYPKTNWLPFVVINSEEESQDGVTLLHEMGHAADVPGRKDAPVGKDDVVHNFMEYGDNRNDMHKQQVIAIAKAYFSK